MTPAVPVDYRSVEAVTGPLLVVREVGGVGFDEVAEILLPDGTVRHGVVLEVDGDLAVLQVYEGTRGIGVRDTAVRFGGRPFEIATGESWMGRVCNGRGEPIDGGPPIIGEAKPVAGTPINPAHRSPPEDAIVTGISGIDTLTTLVRGQKLPIFSQGGLPHLELAAQIAVQARVEDAPFRIVFCAMGVTHADAEMVEDILQARAETGELAVLINTADDPVIERILTPRIALTVAEQLAFDQGHHVLVIMADVTSYAEAVREVAASRGDVPGRRGYPGYLYSDLASLYERSGRIEGREGSLTLLPVLTMPGGDLTHPVPDLTGYITEGQIVLSPELHGRGIDPAIDALASLSRLMRRGAGPGRTRDDHLDISAQIYAALARARQARDLSELVGADALSMTDQRYIEFADAFEERFLSQEAGEDRTLEESLDLAWEVISILPKRELTMLSPDEIEQRYRGAPG